MIRRIAVLAAAAIIGIAVLGADRPARADAAQVAQSVAVDVTEVTTGGTWDDGNRNGSYRAVVVVEEQGETSSAHVFLQWLADTEGGTQVVASVPIQEVRNQKLDSAYVTLEGDKDNEAKLTISSFDQKTEKEITIVVNATTPGKLSLGK